MSTIIKTSQYAINVENITHAQYANDAVVLFPAGCFPVRVPLEKGIGLTTLLKDAGFVGDNHLLINPSRFVIAQNSGATVILTLAGASKPLIVPVGFLNHLDPVTTSEVVSSVGNVEEVTEIVPTPRKQKSAK